MVLNKDWNRWEDTLLFSLTSSGYTFYYILILATTSNIMPVRSNIIKIIIITTINRLDLKFKKKTYSVFYRIFPFTLNIFCKQLMNVMYWLLAPKVSKKNRDIIFLNSLFIYIHLFACIMLNKDNLTNVVKETKISSVRRHSIQG